MTIQKIECDLFVSKMKCLILILLRFHFHCMKIISTAHPLVKTVFEFDAKYWHWSEAFFWNDLYFVMVYTKNFFPIPVGKNMERLCNHAQLSSKKAIMSLSISPYHVYIYRYIFTFTVHLVQGIDLIQGKKMILKMITLTPFAFLYSES